MIKKFCLTLAILCLTACSTTEHAVVSKPRPNITNKDFSGIPVVEDHKSYNLKMEQIWDIFGKKMGDYVLSTTNKAFKSTVACGATKNTVYGTDLVKAGCPNKERSIYISSYAPKDAKVAVCEDTNSPALKNGTITIALKEQGSNTIVSVWVNFRKLHSEVKATGIASDDDGNVGLEYGTVTGTNYCWSTGVIEKGVFDLIESNKSLLK